MAKKSTKRKTEKLSLFQRFGLFFYDHRETTLLFWIALVLLGSASYGWLLQRQGFPEVSVPISMGTGTYFVNDAEKIDQEITTPIAKEIASIPEVKQVNAVASSNFYTFFMEYDKGVTSTEGSNAVAKRVKDKNLLPTGATIEFKPINAAKFEEDSDLLVALHGDENTSVTDLRTKAQAALKQLQTTEGVSKAVLLDPISTGFNPQTRQVQTEQRRFDRVGVKEGGETTFYPSVVMGVKAAGNVDAIHLYDNVTETLDKLNNDQYRLLITENYAEGIHAQIDSLQHNLLEGLAVVILVSMLLISWRASLVLALSMVTVILVTVAVLLLTGNTLNTITLFALILSLGLIVDDTTIMVEAIDANKRASKSRREVLAISMKKVARASTSGTLVTMLAFAPMLFISGILGSFIRVLPITIIISLAASLTVSLLLVPLLSRYIVLGNRPKTVRRNPVMWLENSVASFLSRQVARVNRKRKSTVIIPALAVLFSLVVVALSGQFFSKLKFDIFPSTKDSDVMSVAIRFPPGTSITAAEDRTDAANQIIGRVLGDNLKRLNYDATGSTTQATAMILLEPYQERDVKTPELVNNLTQAFRNFPGASVKVSQIDAGPPKEDYPFKVQFVGQDRTKLRRAANAMAEELNGKTVTRPNGTTAKITRVEVDPPTMPLRLNDNALIEVRAGYNADDTSALVTVTKQDMQDSFNAAKLRQYGLNSANVQYDFGFESDNNESFRSMLIAFPLLLISMYILMLVQFKSFLQPLLIFTAIPYSFFGVGFGLYVTDNPLSFFVMIGFFALIGIAINNTILLTDYANQARDQGLRTGEAMASAIKARFRPLITTSLTSIVALLPLALTDPFWESLAYTLIFGLMSSTLLVIISFPYAYLGLEWLREKLSLGWRKLRRKPAKTAA